MCFSGDAIVSLFVWTQSGVYVKYVLCFYSNIFKADMDNKENIKILLMLYQQHPCLYVTKSHDYHNRMKRDYALQVICKQYTELTGLSLTADIAKKKINNLRSQYLDQLNKIKQSKASGASTDDVYKPTWWLFEEMNFLNPHIAQRKGESSITISNSQSELSEPRNVSIHVTRNEKTEDDLQFSDVCSILNTTDYDKENTEPNIESPLPSYSNSSTPSSVASIIKKRKKITVQNETSEDKNNFWEIASRSLKCISENEKLEDGVKHWVLYLESELHKITDPKKLKRLG